VILAVAAGTALYALTCAPTVLWGDSVVFQARVRELDWFGTLGLALAHPVYIALARVMAFLPLGDFAHRVNLFSGLCAALSLGVSMDLLLSLTRDRLSALCGTLLLAVSHTFWTHAVIAEVYSLYGLGLLTELWLLERFFRFKRPGWLVLALLVNGLNTANHLLAVLNLPVYVVIIVWMLRTRRMPGVELVWIAAAYLIGLSPYLVMIGVELARGAGIADTIRSALFGIGFQDRVLNASIDWLTQARRALSFFALNFPTPLALAAPIGLAIALRQTDLRWFAAAGGAAFLIAFAFAFRYDVPDQYVFFFPCYVVCALFAAIPLGRWAGSRRWRRLACVAAAILPVAVYEAAPAAARRFSVDIGAANDIAMRDEHAFFLRPRKNGDRSAQQFATAALRRAAPDGILMATSTVLNVLVYVRDYEGVAPSVVLCGATSLRASGPVVAQQPAMIAEAARAGRAYSASDQVPYVSEWVVKEYDLVEAFPVHRLVPRGVSETRRSGDSDRPSG
jgi:hypothetical protein